MHVVVWIVQAVLILAKIFLVPPVATWSWWWVFSPIIGMISLGLLGIVVGFFMVLIFQGD